jgi:signal transduction histidine kinase
LFLAFILALWTSLSLMPQPKKIELRDVDGYCDMSGAAFEGTVYCYTSNWDGWPEKLYTPEDFIAGPSKPQGGSPDYINVQYATYRLRLKLPPGRTYGLCMTTSDFSMRIFIDGVQEDSVGTPGTTREETVPRVLERTYYFTEPDGETEIILQTANFVHAKDGVQPPSVYIGAYEDIIRFTNVGFAMGVLVAGCLLSMFLYHLGLFCLNRSRKFVLVFAVACLLLALMNKKLYFLLFPEYNWFVAIRVEYFIHFLTFFMLVLFVDMFHPKTLSKYVTRAYYALTAAYLLTLSLDTRVFTGLLIGFEIASVLMIGYIVVRLAVAFKGGSMKNWLSFSGVLVLGLLGSNDILYYRGIVLIPPISGQFFFTPFGMVFFVFCYAMVLSIEYAETELAMQNAREAEQILAAENAALDRLNLLKTDLMATISHETRTPLAIMSNYAELIAMRLRRKGVDEQTASDLDNISDEILRIAGIMEEMHKFSHAKDSSMRKERVRLADIINRCAKFYVSILERKGTGLCVNLPENLPMIFANAEELTQVMFNLLQNARNHTENGMVRIDVSINDEDGESEIVVSVSDTGTGIAPEFLPQAFERYAHDDPAGTGLGLFLCREIVEAHCGSIEIESTPGHGTIVRFTLPVNRREDENG